MVDRTPDLDRSIRTIKNLQRDIFQRSSANEIAEMYAAAIGLLYFLKVDQEVLQRTRDVAVNEEKTPQCPSPTEIPAISAVVYDSQLFTALLQCLSPSATPPSFETEASTAAAGGVRKRSLSFSNNEPTSNKFMKTTHSPNPVGRKLVDHAVMPQYSLATLAATILYASFAHLDHWPPSLVKAYADDVFGPRLWIDDANCRLLVQNLELCHRSSVIPTTTEDGMAQAALVSEAYQELSVSSPTISRGSVSSYGSSQEQGKRKRGESGNSSSSGEEDEEIVLTAKGGSNKVTRRRKRSGYPVNQTNLHLESVRPRYFGVNFEIAVDRIASSLHERLDVKSKQNSGLLQALPMFVSIPKVRSLIASNLSKWLQSPALAGLARTLFSATVNHMKHEDPPLPDDLLAIDSILAMRLKANQLNAHIENITAIAKRIPTLTVVRRMYSKLLRDEIGVLSSPSHASSESTNFLKMVGAIHAVVPAQVSHDAIASTFLMMTVHELEDVNENFASNRNRLIFRLRRILRMFSAEISSSFDGVQLMKSFFEFDVNSQGWSPRNEEDKARLMFQCVTLAVAPFVRSKGKANLSETEEVSLSASLLSVRKLFLSWFCTYYGPHFSSKLRKRIAAQRDKHSVGAGLPNFRSTLANPEDEKIPAWLNTLRCMLFIEEPDSDLMRQFNLLNGAGASNESTKEWETEIDSVKLCCKYGADVTDELILIVLEASREDGEGLQPEMSLEIIENLLESCTKHREGKVKVSDPSLIWEMYNLAKYTPSTEVDPPVELPRLALPGIWWRATVVSLVFCGSSGKIADVMWKEHPTLQSLMKMVTSSKYRFPTVDCDDAGRDKMKSAEQKAREEETSIAELLFLTPIPIEEDSSKKAGSRISKRLLKQQKDKDAARLHDERTRRKKMLRSAQKSIMLWDPDGPARKPPREVAELIIAVDNAFELSDEFQKSMDPDFITMTIGNTTREAVERAYDWLIPIVSKFPEIIARLHSSTSCFLLLRAHGNDGDEKKELWDLAAPLLKHVQQSLIGKFGTGETVKAFELLMSDVASHNPDRRRCARRVLQESLPDFNEASTKLGSWMGNILLLKDASHILPDAVNYMATAASFERGSVLRSLIVSLQQIMEYSEKNGVDVSFQFADLVVDLISKRPSVLAEAIDSYTDLRSIIIKVIFEEFSTRVQTSDEFKITHSFDQSIVAADHLQGIPLSLVQSISVFLSLWKDEYRTAEGDSSKYIEYLADALLHQHAECEKEEDIDVRFVDTKTSFKKNITVPVELWIMLAKARSDAIARRAALSAPASFLPRLLLCSGLPRASLMTMIDRLGRLGQRAPDMTATYLDLMAPSASSHWDIGRIGTKRQISRKLLGRLTSCISLHGIDLSDNNTEVSTDFIKWLSQTYLGEEAKSKGKEKTSSVKIRSSLVFSSKMAKSALDDTLDLVLPFQAKKECNEWIEMKPFMSVQKTAGASTVVSISEGIEQGDVNVVEAILASMIDNSQDAMCDCATTLVRCVYKQKQLKENNLSLLLKWFPVLTKTKGAPELWKAVFSISVCEKVSSSLVMKATESWTSSHQSDCLDWISKEMRVANDAAVHVVNVVRFLINIIPVHFRSPIQMTSSPNQRTLDAQAIEGMISIALFCLKCAASTSDIHAALGFDFGLWVSSLGKSSFETVTNSVVAEIEAETDLKLKPVFSSFFLRLYLKHSLWLDLSLERTRQLVMKASELFQEEFTEWTSSLDGQIDEVIESVSSGQFRSIKILNDMARKHPLIVLRRGKNVALLLEHDASNTERDNGTRGKVHGEGFDDPREAIIMSTTVTVTVRHWGYSYTEPVWAAFLDIVSSVPKEVLFGCGFRLGLNFFLVPYLKLLPIQLQLRSREKCKRIHSKLAALLKAFQQHKPDEWRRWLSSKIDENEVRHLLIVCDFLTPQEAVESLKPIQ